MGNLHALGENWSRLSLFTFADYWINLHKIGVDDYREKKGRYFMNLGF